MWVCFSYLHHRLHHSFNSLVQVMEVNASNPSTDADEDEDTSSEPSIEEVTDEIRTGLEDVTVANLLVHPTIRQVTLETITARSPPVLKENESMQIPSPDGHQFKLQWDIDGLEVCATPEDFYARLADCNASIKASPER